MSNPFHASFGVSPPLLVGRDGLLEDFVEALEDGPGRPAARPYTPGHAAPERPSCSTRSKTARRSAAGWSPPRNKPDATRPGSTTPDGSEKPSPNSKPHPYAHSKTPKAGSPKSGTTNCRDIPPQKCGTSALGGGGMFSSPADLVAMLTAFAAQSPNHKKVLREKLVTTSQKVFSPRAVVAAYDKVYAR